MENTLKINLTNNRDKVYHVGDIVKGNVQINFVKASLVKGLRLTLEGQAECWRVYEGYLSDPVRTVQNKQMLMESSVKLFGSKDCAAVKFQPGHYAYNFDLLLPDNLPASVKGVNGKISYKFEATLFKPWSCDLQVEKTFTVDRTENLSRNELYHLRSPKSCEGTEAVREVLFRSRPVVIKISLEKTCFGLGERVPIRIKIENNSRKNVNKIKLILRRTETCSSLLPYGNFQTTEFNINSRLIKQMVKAGKSEDFTTYFIVSHNLLVSNDHLNVIFKIGYEIKVELAEIATLGSNVVIPIKIGAYGRTHKASSASEESPPSYKEAIQN